jgi:tetratricopeptide (TPR) repeat protein
MYRKFLFSLIMIFIAAATLTAAEKVASATKQVDPVVMTNQLMLVFMERMKNKDYKEAREIVKEMLYGHEKFVDTDKVEYRSFHSAMEKELYEMKQAEAGNTKRLIWIEQPISDGYYLLAILDFQEGNHDQALANLQKAINWNPVRSAFYTERGFMLLRQKTGPDHLMAEIAYKKALELADNGEDFAAALRGLAFVLVERRRLADALACLLVSKNFDPSSLDAEEEMLFIRRADPELFANMSMSEAKELMKLRGIQSAYSPEHIRVLIKLADELISKKAADKAVLLLKKAREMDPKNQDVAQRLKKYAK